MSRIITPGNSAPAPEFNADPAFLTQNEMNAFFSNLGDAAHKGVPADHIFPVPFGQLLRIGSNLQKYRDFIAKVASCASVGADPALLGTLPAEAVGILGPKLPPRPSLNIPPVSNPGESQ